MSTLYCPAGDLLSALLLARLDATPDNLKQAVEVAIASLQGIVLKTYEASIKHLGPDKSVSKVCHRPTCLPGKGGWGGWGREGGHLEADGIGGKF
jgi:hypothetical protein